MSCKTTNLVDPRIDPQPDPVYSRIVGPRQNQFYKMNASSKSDSSITFNNLTTLGVDRAYLDTFELEITAKITFENDGGTGDDESKLFTPRPDEWTFDSFPFAKCCEQVRVNINGGAFFSTPLAYVRAKERYWCEDKLSASYENLCPVHKPHLQNEYGADMSGPAAPDVFETVSDYIFTTAKAVTASGDEDTKADFVQSVSAGSAAPSRFPVAQKYYMQSPSGLSGTNNSIVRLGPPRTDLGALSGVDFINYYWPQDTNTPIKGKKLVVIAKWREPIFCSPFSSRIDATYGRPLYNITSLDLQFTMCPDLGNMIRVGRITSVGKVTKYTVNIEDCQLCYQVMTIPANVVKPPSTLVPYRRFVPYITDINSGNTINGNTEIHVQSGLYTWNEVPQAIWAFLAPTKSEIETNRADGLVTGSWASNKAFGYLQKVDISLANTTQILSTANREDLYRIAKANGCCDSWEAWGVNDAVDARLYDGSDHKLHKKPQGIGSVLRLIPGIDIILPDQDLIPASNANNMVFQFKGDWITPAMPANKYSLWLLFEYNGVASFSPGQCEITMNPLGAGEVFATSPTMSMSGEGIDGIYGSGPSWWERFVNRWKPRIQKIKEYVDKARENHVVSQVLDAVAPMTDNPTVKRVSETVKRFEGPAAKRGRSEGGAVMGLGDFT